MIVDDLRRYTILHPESNAMRRYLGARRSKIARPQSLREWWDRLVRPAALIDAALLRTLAYDQPVTVEDAYGILTAHCANWWISPAAFLRRVAAIEGLGLIERRWIEGKPSDRIVGIRATPRIVSANGKIEHD